MGTLTPTTSTPKGTIYRDEWVRNPLGLHKAAIGLTVSDRMWPVSMQQIARGFVQRGPTEGRAVFVVRWFSMADGRSLGTTCEWADQLEHAKPVHGLPDAREAVNDLGAEAWQVLRPRSWDASDEADDRYERERDHNDAA